MLVDRRDGRQDVLPVNGTEGEQDFQAGLNDGLYADQVQGPADGIEDYAEDEDEDEQPEAREADSSSGMEDDMLEDQPAPAPAGNGADEGNKPLYAGAAITVGQSLLAILTLAMVHGLTGSCIGDLLFLIALHCPEPNVCKRTLFKFNKFFRGIGRELLIFHYFCDSCIYLLPQKNSICAVCNQNQPSFFIELPLFAQLQAMFKRQGFLNALQFRFNRRKFNDESLEDIYDGRQYKWHSNIGGFLSNPHNLSFMCYTDGVQMYKSSTFSIWPLYLVINELPYKERVKKQNIILACLWFGSKKPNPNAFLAPLHSEMTRFQNEGFMFQLSNGDRIRVKAMVLCGTCDTPAKSTFLRMKRHNGFYGCPRCKSPGARYNLSPTSSVHVYPYSRVVDLRTNEEVNVFARQAVEENKVVYGVEGPSVLYYIVHNMILSTGIDSMHAVFSGVGKRLANLWFDPANSTLPFSMSGLVQVVDQELQKIKPPSFVHRMPRSIAKTLALWKSYEFKMWLLYYSIPVLLGIMDPIYMEHHIKLVSAIALLSQRSVSQDRVEIARDLLHNYVSQFQFLYGVRYVGINVHFLLHLPDVVLDLGPLWVYSCYFLEGLNGEMAKLVHGTNHAGLQVCSMAVKLMNLSSMISRLPENSVRTYCEKLTSGRKALKIAEVISPGMCVIGTYKSLRVVPVHISVPLHTCLCINGGRCELFFRLRKKGIVYSSLAYTRGTKTMSVYASFTNANNISTLCVINNFVTWSPDCYCEVGACTCESQWICIGTVYSPLQWFAHTVPNVHLPYLSKVNNSHETVAFPVGSLECLCFYMMVNGGDEYIARPVNLLEAE